MNNYEPEKKFELLGTSEYKTSKFEILALAKTQPISLKNENLFQSPYHEILSKESIVYAIRYPKLSGEKILYSLATTTQSNYQKNYRLDPESLSKDNSVPAPVGGCAFVFSKPDKNGKQFMFLQTRPNKNEYQDTLGGTGKILSAHFNPDGTLIPIEEVFDDEIKEIMAKELGITQSHIEKSSLIALIKETDPKLHHELIVKIESNLTPNELLEACAMTRGENNLPKDVVVLPVEIKAIETILTKFESPIPPSHEGGLVSIGYQIVLKEEGLEKAEQWLIQILKEVDAKNERIDERVHEHNRNLTGYSPDFSTRNQGLPSPIEAFYKAGLLTFVVDSTNIPENQEIFKPSEVCITGGIHYPKVLENTPAGDSDRVRGKLTIDSIVDYLTHGFNVAALVSTVTPKEYLSELWSKVEGLKGKLLIIDEPKDTPYGTGRQLIAQTALEKFQDTTAILTLEFEKPLESKMQALLSGIKDGCGLVIPSRNGLLDIAKVNLPFMQFLGESAMNTAFKKIADRANIPMKWLELLNGTRVINTQEIHVTVDGILYKVRPIDIFNLKYAYKNTDDDPGIKYKYPVQHYGPVYNLVPIMAALGINIGQFEINYKHPEDQRSVEEDEDNKAIFDQKRINQKNAIIFQDFDMVANIIRWKEEGRWPQIIFDSIKNKEPLVLTHYDPSEYKIKDGKLIKRSN